MEPKVQDIIERRAAGWIDIIQTSSNNGEWRGSKINGGGGIKFFGLFYRLWEKTSKCLISFTQNSKYACKKHFVENLVPRLSFPSPFCDISLFYSTYSVSIIYKSRQIGLATVVERLAHL